MRGAGPPSVGCSRADSFPFEQVDTHRQVMVLQGPRCTNYSIRILDKGSGAANYFCHVTGEETSNVILAKADSKITNFLDLTGF